MVADNIDPVRIPKEGLEPVSDRYLHLSAKPEVVIPRQARDQLFPSLPTTRHLAAVVEVIKEDIPEPLILRQPVVLAVFTVPRINPPLLVAAALASPFRIDKFPARRFPFPSTVEEIAEEEERVGGQPGLQGPVGPEEVVVCDYGREGREGPGTAGVAVRIDDLGIGYEYQAMRMRTSGLLYRVSASVTSSTLSSVDLTQSSQWSQSHLATLLSNTQHSPHSKITIQIKTNRCGKLSTLRGVKFAPKRANARCPSRVAICRPGPQAYVHAHWRRLLRLRVMSSARVVYWGMIRGPWAEVRRFVACAGGGMLAMQGMWSREISTGVQRSGKNGGKEKSERERRLRRKW